MALYAWNNAGHEPARLTHLDYRDQRAVRIEGGEGSAQVVQLLHGALGWMRSRPDPPEPRAVLAAVKAWPGNTGASRNVIATATVEGCAKPIARMSAFGSNSEVLCSQ